MRPTAFRLSTRGARLLRPQPLVRAPLLATHTSSLRPTPAPRARPFSHLSPQRRAEDSAERKPRRAYKAAELSDGEYHELSDYYLDLICTKYEDLQDTRTDVDVEFAVGPPLPPLTFHGPRPIMASFTNMAAQSTNRRKGRRHNNNNSPNRNLRHKQAAPQQGDMALVPHIRPQAVRLLHREGQPGPDRGGALALLQGLHVIA